MRILRCTAMVLMTVVLCLSMGAALGESVPQLLLTALEQTHPQPFGYVDEAVFEAEIEKLSGDWERLMEQGEAGYALARLTASIGDEHTQLAFDRGEDAVLPFYVMCVEGRYLIVQAQQAVSALVGKELTAIGGVPVSELFARVRPYLSGQTDGRLGVEFAQAICSMRMLMQVGAAEGIASAAIEAKDSTTGETIQLTVDTLTGGYDYGASQLMVLEQTLLQSGYYYATLLEQGELFIQYNVCADNPQMPMADFAQAVWEQMSPMKPETIIVDLRHNSGGNSEVINPLLNVLARFVQAGSELYALIGPETFSSGVMNAMDLRQTGAMLVGEATGGVMGFGEVRAIELADGMVLYCSSKDFSGGVWPHEPVYPDETVVQTAEDFARGVDSAIAWIRSR